MIELIVFSALFLTVLNLFVKVGKLEKELKILNSKISKTIESKETSSQEITTAPKETPIDPQPQTPLKIKKKNNPPVPLENKRENLSIEIKDSRGKTYQTKPSDATPNRVTKFIKDYFTQGNIVVRIGGIILFVGIAFLLKYAAQHTTISMEARLIGVAISALVLLTIGWKLRLREGGYGLILQGLGVAILYLVILVAAKQYEMLSLGLAFGLMFVVVIFASLLALSQNALPLALFSLVGGFMAPILTSDGSGSHIILFSYYVILDIGIVLIAWYRSWRILNLLGFLFTFVIATAWGVLRYDSALFASTEPFLILFFIIYLLISIIFTYKQPFSLRGVVDATLVFGLPLVAFSLQILLVENIAYGEAYSALVLSILYILLYKMLHSRENMLILSEAFLALGVAFGTIAIAYAFDDQMTSALWVLESTAIIWISLRQQRLYARLFGEVLQVVGVLLYVVSSSIFQGAAKSAFSNPEFFGYLIITVATLTSSYLLFRYKEKLQEWEAGTSTLFAIIGIGVWLIAGLLQMQMLAYELNNLMLIYLALSALVLAVVAQRLKWLNLISISMLYLPIGAIFINNIFMSNPLAHPFGGLGIIAFPLFFVVHFWLLHRFDDSWTWQSVSHIVGLWIIVILGVKEIDYSLSLVSQNSNLQFAAIALFPVVISWLILHSKSLFSFAFKKYRNLYRLYGVGGILIGIAIWEFIGFTKPGDMTPLSYIPILNPLDLMQFFGIAILFDWYYMHRDRFDRQRSNAILVIGALLGVVLASVVLARSVHFYKDIPYDLEALSGSLLFQTALSILWTLIAMTMMIIAKRYGSRMVWRGGFGLLALVVVKLFFVELAGSGTVERIISFIVVGSLLLLVGYLAPIPPKADKDTEVNEGEAGD